MKMRNENTYMKPTITLKNEDIFELMRREVGWEYISDLRLEGYLPEARRLIRSIPLDVYSLWELEDMANYLYGGNPSFVDMEQALSLLEDNNSCIDIVNRRTEYLHLQ